MSTLEIIWLICAFASLLLSGVFLAFSSFIMAALNQIQPVQGITAMQAINVTVLNPLFMSLFIGTALVSLVSMAYAFFTSDPALTSLNLSGCLFYGFGGFGITAIGNVPLNERLAKMDPQEGDTQLFWQTYVVNWTRWNHIRALAMLLASVCWILPAHLA